MESTLATPSSAAGPVTFSHVFGQQCQLMEAGRKLLWEVGCYPRSPEAEAHVCLRVCLFHLCLREIWDARFNPPVTCLSGSLTVKFLARAMGLTEGATWAGEVRVPMGPVTSFLCGCSEDAGE